MEPTHDPWLISGVPVTLRRSARRRTVGLQVRPGQVTLYAPTGVSLQRLGLFLAERRSWAEAHLQRYAARSAPRGLQDGARLPFLGEMLTLRIDPAHARTIRQGPILVLPSINPEQALERWTRHAAAGPYRKRVEDWADALGARDRLGRVLVSGARTRWGSCTQNGDIRLHWRLTRAPLEVLDYVALHEAAHLLELNHSARYWAHVARWMPDYPQARRWLREHGHDL
ncbi:M48 family metallopeptidase [Deinococcus navajonensis]|uniref:M48 family metallopeptidase n=1 Tax=Deinococcus navajonensis TaxID=309884 RepID=A0ABV8XQ01_9DEIO